MRSHSTSTAHRPFSIDHSSGDRGVALILTLAILALVTLLLIAFVTSMRVENAASKNFNEAVKARELAQAGVAEAVGAIRLAAPIIGPPPNGSNYVTAPGVIYTCAAGAWTSNSLFTSVNISDPNPLQAKVVDLNTNYVITGQGTFYTAGNVPLYAGWSNVVITNAAAPNGQLIGRYAYWVDDESTKVNLNVAGTRASDPSGLTPAAIDLRQLFAQADQINITNYVSKVRPLDTIQSVKMSKPPLQGQYAPNLSGDFTTPTESLYSNNQFYVTVHSTSPDVTPWGTQRVNLSNIVMAVDNGNPQQAVTAITNALSDPNLRLWFGQDFSQKYPNVQQIAVNIVDYIRPSAIPQIPTDSSAVGWSDTQPPTYLGLRQTPYLNELVISNICQVGLVPGSSPPQYTLTVTTYPVIELWYMYTNANWALPSPAEVLLRNVPGIAFSGSGAPAPITFPANSATIAVNSGMPAVPPNGYSFKTSTVTTPLTFGPFTLSSLPLTVNLSAGTVTAILRIQGAAGVGGRLDYAQIPVRAQTLNIANPGTLTANWESACNDPRVKPVSTSWTTLNQGQSTLGAVNANAINMTAGGSGFLGDGDISCHIISGSNQRGQMCPSELAYIHTGIPWRTLWLEHQPSAEGNVIPDWLAVDLFSGSSITNVDVPGRMNINAAINNVPSPSGGSLPQRVAPLVALLGNSSSMSAANNIYTYTVHNTHNPISFVRLFNAFTTAGQVCEVEGLADGPGNKATREAPAQEILNLVTPRSNTFTIWCLAQSVKKVDKTFANLPYFTPGVDVVTGEAKVQAIVERTVDSSSGTPQVKFRTLYYRYYYQ
jgi:hypothetical protein